MILDNENDHLKIYEWIEKYTSSGSVFIVTGYFTVGGLAFLAKSTSDKVKSYRIVLGDIVSQDNDKSRGLDLLNEDISVVSVFGLKGNARDAVEFLQKENVQIKTLEPNFCHAKVCLYQHEDHNPQMHYFISGSSNLTEAGMGLKFTNNIELNVAGFGADLQYNDLMRWFAKLWERPQAHTTKTLISPTGDKTKRPLKEYLISEIKKIYREYTPLEIYYKVLFEMFGKDLLVEANDPDFTRRIGRLENTQVYNALYEFQRKGAISLIKMLEKYNGAVLADAVGLGKTWSALAVMKFYQMQGREVVLLCPKKLEHNWRAYQKNHHSRFEKDALEFFMRYHTDLTPELMKKYTDRSDKFFRNDKPKLFVIDESHNLRNDKSQRYEFLVKEILSQCEDAKVLMLSATPINNTLLDIRNQFKLMVGGRDAGFEETLDIRSLEATFRRAQQTFNEWAAEESPRIYDFVRNLPPNFFNLTDALIVARTRPMIEGHQNGLDFPIKIKPENLFVTPREIGEFQHFEDLYDAFPPHLSGYAPAQYVEQDVDVDILKDERQRDYFLIKMMYILLVKRLESSWFAFDSTVAKVLSHHENALQRIDDYEKAKNSLAEADEWDVLNVDEELEEDLDSFTLGKKRTIQLKDIDACGLLDVYRSDLEKDATSLHHLQINLHQFKQQVNAETGPRSVDIKLQTLIERINAKRRSGANNGNQKVLIFTVYKDTAFYLFDELTKRGFTNVAAVSGDESRVWNQDYKSPGYEPILERFAPFTKLFREKEWPEFTASPGAVLLEQFEEWKVWIRENNAATHHKLQNPIDILIATDALSEGQNLQDCDMVINYDIHWNPVRVIQRMGRIDRLGSPNTEIFGINFWPSDNINEYLNLQNRIEKRMAAMKLAGAEVQHEFSSTFQEMAEDKNLEQRQREKMLRQMEDSWDEIDDGSQNLGFDDLSLEPFRQDLLEELRRDEQFYNDMPRGVYSGYKTLPEICPQGGLVALLGYPHQPSGADNFAYQQYHLIYIDSNGDVVFKNQKEVLDVLSQHKMQPRQVSSKVDHGEPQAIQALSDMLHKWLHKQAVTEEVQPDGTVKTTMGSEGKVMMKTLKAGGKKAVEAVKLGPIADKYIQKDFDLIAWFAVEE